MLHPLERRRVLGNNTLDVVSLVAHGEHYADEQRLLSPWASRRTNSAISGGARPFRARTRRSLPPSPLQTSDPNPNRCSRGCFGSVAKYSATMLPIPPLTEWSSR